MKRTVLRTCQIPEQWNCEELSTSSKTGLMAGAACQAGKPLRPGPSFPPRRLMGCTPYTSSYTAPVLLRISA